MSDDYCEINNYILKENIGEGNFGKVKLGVYKPTGEEFAIKIMNKKKIKRKMKNIIFKENEIITKFNHINVIYVFQIIEDAEYYYIVMEYCKLGELFDYIVKKRRLNENEASNFFYQLINGLEHIHSKKIAHRDLKPENLLLTEDKVLKIIDFGLSHEFDGKELLKTKCGSPSYASPEVICQSAYDGFKSDIWCCGIILYAMLCGFLPFEGDDNESNNNLLFKNILECQPEMPEFLSDISKDLISLILTPNPDERITLEEIKKHPFYLKGKNNCSLDYTSIEKSVLTTRSNFSRTKKSNVAENTNTDIKDNEKNENKSKNKSKNKNKNKKNDENIDELNMNYTGFKILNQENSLQKKSDEDVDAHLKKNYKSNKNQNKNKNSTENNSNEDKKNKSKNITSNTTHNNFKTKNKNTNEINLFQKKVSPVNINEFNNKKLELVTEKIHQILKTEANELPQKDLPFIKLKNNKQILASIFPNRNDNLLIENKNNPDNSLVNENDENNKPSALYSIKPSSNNNYLYFHIFGNKSNEFNKKRQNDKIMIKGNQKLITEGNTHNTNDDYILFHDLNMKNKKNSKHNKNSAHSNSPINNNNSNLNSNNSNRTISLSLENKYNKNRRNYAYDYDYHFQPGNAKKRDVKMFSNNFNTDDSEVNRQINNIKTIIANNTIQVNQNSNSIDTKLQKFYKNSRYPGINSIYNNIKINININSPVARHKESILEYFNNKEKQIQFNSINNNDSIKAKTKMAPKIHILPGKNSQKQPEFYNKAHRHIYYSENTNKKQFLSLPKDKKNIFDGKINLSKVIKNINNKISTGSNSFKKNKSFLNDKNGNHNNTITIQDKDISLFSYGRTNTIENQTGSNSIKKLVLSNKNKNKNSLSSNKEDILMNVLTIKNQNKGNNGNKNVNDYNNTHNYLPMLTSHIQNSLKKQLQ